MFGIQNTMTFSKVWIQTASPVQILRCGVFPLRNGCSLLVPCKSNMTVHRVWIMQQSFYVPYRCSLCTAGSGITGWWTTWSKQIVRSGWYPYPLYILFSLLAIYISTNMFTSGPVRYLTWWFVCSRYLNGWYTCIGAKQLPIIQSCETYM